MKVLFIGGKGNISAAVSRHAISKRIKLYHLNRGQTKVNIPGVQSIKGDYSNHQALKECLKDHQWDVVVNWIAFNEADVNSETLSRTDTNSDGNENNLQAGTRKANAKISDHVTYYGELVLGAGIYGKVGFAQVDIETTESTATTVTATTGSYPNKTLDAWTYGIGQKGNFGTNGFYKVEGFITDYDNFSATSTGGVGNANTVSADLDVVGASLKIGLKF